MENYLQIQLSLEKTDGIPYIHIMKKILLILTILFQIQAFAVFADGNPVFTSFKSVSMDRGLSSNKIMNVTKDSLGTLWIGTYHGLNRIIENETIQYNSEGLQGKCIDFMFTDNTGTIWIRTSSGLFRYDYYSDTFLHTDIEGVNLTASSYDLTSDGVFFTSNIGIIKWDYHSEEFDIILKDQYYSHIHILDNSFAIVAANSDGIYKINLHTGEKEPIFKLEETDTITSSIIDSYGRLWIGLYGKGLYCLSANQGGALYRLTAENSSLGDNIVLCMQEYDGELWIGTDGSGLRIMDLSSMSISKLPIGNDIQHKLNTVSCIYKENEEILIGTIRHGLQFLSQKPIRHISSKNINGISSKEDFVVQCFCEQPDGKIWIGTDGSGLYVLDPKTNIINPDPVFKDNKIVSVAFYDKRTLLVSIYDDGIYIYDPETHARSRAVIHDRETDRMIFSKDRIVGLQRLSNGEILVLADMIYHFEPETRSIARIHIPVLSRHKSFRVFPTSSEDILIVTGKDVYQVTGDMSVSHLYTSDTDITAATKTAESLWLSDSYSLYRIKGGAESAERIKNINPHKIYTLSADNNDNVWVIQYDRFIRISDKDTSKVRIFDHSDGVMPNDYYYPEIMLKSKNGDLYFGGSQGMNIIVPSKISQCSPDNSISIVKVSVDGQHFKYAKEGNTSRIDVPWDYNSIEIKIGINGSNIFKEHKYRFEIKKRGKTVKTIEGKSLFIPALSSGTYHIDIYVGQAPGQWSKASEDISLNIRQSTWQQILMIVALYILILGSITLLVFLYYRKEKRKSTRLYNERKKELSDNKLKFLINMSHELRTPLTLIYAPLKRILERESLPAEYRKDLSPVYHQAMQMIRIINIILDSRKFEEGYSRLIISPVHFNEWARNIAEGFKIEYEAKGIGIRYRFDDSIGTVNMDEGKCSMALSNLMMNAYKYSPAGTRVTVHTYQEEGFVKLSVEDEGIGISGSDTENIFRRFERNVSSANGFGLGLAYTKQIIEAHPGGCIGADKNDGAGSTFWFRIPADLENESMNSGKVYNDPGHDIGSEDMSSVSEGAEGKAVEFDTSGYTILIADDEPELLKFMETSLKDCFRQIITASNGVEAYEKTIKHSPGIIISDVMMPQMNGFDLCRKIKNKLEISHIPVILLTAQADIAHRTEGYKSGADLFISKPFDIQDILTAIKSTLSNRAIIRNLYKTDFSSVTAATTSFSNADERFLRKVESFIMENISNDSLDAQMIIEHMCMSRSNFYKKMKELTDIGIKEYVNNIRMRQAAQLLKDKGKQISEIALEVGFTDNQYFSKVFKAYYKMSPSSYRKNLNPDSL